MRNFLNFKNWSLPPEPEISEIKTRNDAITRMINLRRVVDKRLKKEKRAEHWPMFKVEQSVEGFIANVVELSEVLQGDGYTVEESMNKLLATLGLPQDSCSDLISYLQLRLKMLDPAYLALGTDLFDQAVAFAKTAAALEIQSRKIAPEFPPTAWRVDKISCEDIVNGVIYEQKLSYGLVSLDGSPTKVKKDPRHTLLPNNKKASREWGRFQLRMKPDDEIWTFSSLITKIKSPWHQTGVCLIRRGETIECIVEEMHLYYGT